MSKYRQSLRKKNCAGKILFYDLWIYVIFSSVSFVLYVRYFIVTNATTTFRSIVSSYPGELVLVSIQVVDGLFCLLSICWIHFFVCICH